MYRIKCPYCEQVYEADPNIKLTPTDEDDDLTKVAFK